MLEKKINGCNGACCEGFSFPFSLEKLKALSESDGEEIEMKPKQLWTISKTGHTKQELQFIADMLIFLRESDVCVQTGKSLLDDGTKKNWKAAYAWDKESHFNHYQIEEDSEGEVTSIKALIYTCKHYDKETTLCTQYENRPPLCKDFGAHCGYEGCFFKTKKRLQDLAWSEEYDKETKRLQAEQETSPKIKDGTHIQA